MHSQWKAILHGTGMVYEELSINMLSFCSETISYNVDNLTCCKAKGKWVSTNAEHALGAALASG